MATSKKPPWYRVLEASRRISGKGEITARTLGLEAKLTPSDASAWLCKFVKWGYARRLGRSTEGGKTVAYELTGYGLEVGAPKRRHYTGG